VGALMPVVNKKSRILSEFMSGKINNHVALKLKVSRQYVTQIRIKYQSLSTKKLLDKIATTKHKFNPLEYIDYKWLIDAKLIKVISKDFLKNKNVRLTPTGEQWLAFLKTIPEAELSTQDRVAIADVFRLSEPTTDSGD
jgi:hypothetical protein